MEFQIWGKLDEDGRIQTVQSSCSHTAEQGPSGVQQTSEGKGEWAVSRQCESPGDELLSVDEKKKLVYQLDSKIDEMSCIMVRLGDLTKTLNYQEKLINEYEERMRRQEQDNKLLRAENMLLRRGNTSVNDVKISTVTTGLLPSSETSASSSLAMQATYSSTHMSSSTIPKRVRTSLIEMKCSLKCTSNDDQTRVKYPSWPTIKKEKPYSPESISDLQSGADFVNIRENTDKLTADVIHSAHSRESSQESNRNAFENNNANNTNIPVHNNQDKVIGIHATDGTRKENIDGLTQENSNNHNRQVQKNSSTCTDTRAKVAPSPPHVSKHADNSNSSKTSMSPAITTRTSASTPAAVGNKLEVDLNGYIILGKAEHDEEDVHGTWLSVNQTLRSARREKSETATADGQLDEVDGQTCPCTANVSSEVQIRFKMDPTRRAKSLDGYNLIEDDQVVDPPILPPRPKTLTVLSKGPTDGMPATSNSGTEKRKDDALNCVMRTMRTTMEWNKARKTLMKKSTSCTVDMVERSLGQLVQDMCHTLASLKDKKYASLSPPKIAKLRKVLKNSHDGDIMTEDFLKKCSGLYLNS